MFDPIGDRHVAEENAFLKNQALAVGEENPVFADVTSFLDTQVCEKFVQSLAPGVLLNSPCRFLEPGFLSFQSRYSVGHRSSLFCRRPLVS